MLPYDWLADNTRWQRKPRTFDSIEQALQDTARFYRKSLWNDAGDPVLVPAAVMPWAIGATTVLTALVLVAGLWPGPILELGRAAAAGLLDPGGYIRAVGLGPWP